MIIDLILDRKDGQEYNAKQFYNNLMKYYQTFPETVEPLAHSFDAGEEQDVKRELAKYIKENDYNLNIIKYINQVDWLINY